MIKSHALQYVFHTIFHLEYRFQFCNVIKSNVLYRNKRLRSLLN